MKRIALVLMLALVAAPAFSKDAAKGAASKAEWHMNATIIEACSCPMFCQCYFASKPAAHATADHAEGEHAHGAEHFCRANNVFRVNQGHDGATKLDGAKFWIGMDLGDDFSDGTMMWANIHFDPSVTKEQRDAIAKIVGFIYPVKWETPVSVGDDYPIEWSHEGDRAVAKLDGGKAGEVVLNGGAVGRNDKSPVVIKNLKYWGVSRHDGFVLMPNEVEAYRLGDKAFEFKGTNGFMITFDINSNDVKPAGSGGGN